MVECYFCDYYDLDRHYCPFHGEYYGEDYECAQGIDMRVNKNIPITNVKKRHFYVIVHPQRNGVWGWSESKSGAEARKKMIEDEHPELRGVLVIVQNVKELQFDNNLTLNDLKTNAIDDQFVKGYVLELSEKYGVNAENLWNIVWQHISTQMDPNVAQETMDHWAQNLAYTEHSIKSNVSFYRICRKCKFGQLKGKGVYCNYWEIEKEAHDFCMKFEQQELEPGIERWAENELKDMSKLNCSDGNIKKKDKSNMDKYGIIDENNSIFYTDDSLDKIQDKIKAFEDEYKDMGYKFKIVELTPSNPYKVAINAFRGERYGMCDVCGASADLKFDEESQLDVCGNCWNMKVKKDYSKFQGQYVKNSQMFVRYNFDKSQAIDLCQKYIKKYAKKFDTSESEAGVRVEGNSVIFWFDGGLYDAFSWNSDWPSVQGTFEKDFSDDVKKLGLAYEFASATQIVLYNPDRINTDWKLWEKDDKKLKEIDKKIEDLIEKGEDIEHIRRIGLYDERDEILGRMGWNLKSNSEYQADVYERISHTCDVCTNAGSIKTDGLDEVKMENVCKKGLGYGSFNNGKDCDSFNFGVKTNQLPRCEVCNKVAKVKVTTVEGIYRFFCYDHYDVVIDDPRQKGAVAKELNQGPRCETCNGIAKVKVETTDGYIHFFCYDHYDIIIDDPAQKGAVAKVLNYEQPLKDELNEIRNRNSNVRFNSYAKVCINCEHYGPGAGWCIRNDFEVNEDDTCPAFKFDSDDREMYSHDEVVLMRNHLNNFPNVRIWAIKNVTPYYESDDKCCELCRHYNFREEYCEEHQEYIPLKDADSTVCETFEWHLQASKENKNVMNFDFVSALKKEGYTGITQQQAEKFIEENYKAYLIVPKKGSKDKDDVEFKGPYNVKVQGDKMCAQGPAGNYFWINPEGRDMNDGDYTLPKCLKIDDNDIMWIGEYLS